MRPGTNSVLVPPVISETDTFTAGIQSFPVMPNTSSRTRFRVKS